MKEFGNTRINLYEYLLNDPNNEIEKKFSLLGYIIRKIRRILRNITIFQYGDSILADSDIYTQIKHLDLITNDKKVIDYFVQKKRVAFFDEVEANGENDDLFLKYVGERIAVVLRNREDNFIVYEEYGKNVFQATSPEYDDIYGKIIVHNGFRYKPLILNEEQRQVGVIIEPRSKFFSEKTLREYLPHVRSELSNRYCEKICPVVSCKNYLNPYGTCNLNYPSSFGNIDDLKFVEEKPSETTINLFEFYSDETNCPTKFLVERIKDETPVIHKSFLSNPEKNYSYPLEVIRVNPRMEDAGSDSRRLMKKIQPKPFERFGLIKNLYMKVLMDIRDLEFPLIPDSMINTTFRCIEPISLTNPTYLLKSKSSEFPSLEYKETEETGFYKESCYGKSTIIFQLFYFESDNRIKDIKDILESKKRKIQNITSYKYFSKVKEVKYNQTKIKNLTDVEKILSKENETEFNFYIIIGNPNYEPLHNEVKSFLIQNEKPNQTIKVQTLDELGFSSLTSHIFLQIYQKSGGITWLLEKTPRNDELIVGFSLKYFKEHILASILLFSNQGHFKEGIFLKEKVENFHEILAKIIRNKFNRFQKITLLYQGAIQASFLEVLTDTLKNKELDIIEVIENSLVRIFNKNEITERIYPPNPGIGIILNGNEMHLISTKTRIGTPSCIKVRRVIKASAADLAVFQNVFTYTRFNPALIKNSTKLPFPIHFSKNALKKGIMYNLKTFYYSKPFFL